MSWNEEARKKLKTLQSAYCTLDGHGQGPVTTGHHTAWKKAQDRTAWHHIIALAILSS